MSRSTIVALFLVAAILAVSPASLAQSRKRERDNQNNQKPKPPQQVDLTLLHKRAEGVFVASGKHVYRYRSRNVYVSYVLESLGDQWTLTQRGTAPDCIQERE